MNRMLISFSSIGILGYMGTYSDDRQPVLNKLLVEPATLNPHRKFVVAGPQYPSHIHWPANVFRMEHLPPEQHRQFYNSQKYTLNVTRSDMIKSGYSPSVRLFEAAGCVTPIISDYWEGLDSIFTPGEDILIASNALEVDTILKKVSESERKNIAINAYMKVLSHHTAAHRAKELEKYVEEVSINKKAQKRVTQFLQ